MSRERDLIRQLNDLKRQNRDLRLEMMDLQNAGGGSGGGGGGPQVAAMQQHIQKLEAALAHASQSKAPSAGPAASTDVYDGIISTLEGALSHLKRERQHAPLDKPGGGGGDGDPLLKGQIKELERLNRDLERDLARAQEAGGGAPNPALKAEYERALAHIKGLEESNRALEQAASGGRGDIARQLNDLKRQNRDLKLQQGGGGAEADALKQKVQHLEAQLKRAAAGGRGGGGVDGERIRGVHQTLNDLVGSWRGDLRAVDGFINDIRDVFSFVNSLNSASLSGSARARFDDVVEALDLSFIIEELERLTKGQQDSAAQIKDQLRTLRETLSSP